MSIDQVREFHKAFGRPVRDQPTVGMPDERVLRVRLMLEEVLEFAEAAGVDVYCGNRALTPVNFRVDADRPANLAAMLHELADVSYVVDGTAVQLGLPLNLAVTEVHAANMRKLGPDGKPVVDARGKVRKPDGWRPADVAPLLAAFASDAEPVRYVNAAPVSSAPTVREAGLRSGGDCVSRPRPCLDPEKMNGYADQFPGSDARSQYDLKPLPKKPVESDTTEPSEYWPRY